MRYFLEIAYNGSNYHGWQLQKNAHSVQQELNSGLERLFQTEIETLGSGRTDTGVHAEQQFVHFDLDLEITDKHLFQLNCILPADIVIKGCRKVKDTASARFDAISRAYEYRICQHKDPFLKDLTHFFPRYLNIERMNEASEILLKHEDFQSFSKVNTNVEHFLCKMHYAEWVKENNLLIFKVSANRFLRGMVRTLVGTMLEVGMGRMSLEKFEEIIEKKDRKIAGAIVPARGLYFLKIVYPDDIFIDG